MLPGLHNFSSGVFHAIDDSGFVLVSIDWRLQVVLQHCRIYGSVVHYEILYRSIQSMKQDIQ